MHLVANNKLFELQRKLGALDGPLLGATLARNYSAAIKRRVGAKARFSSRFTNNQAQRPCPFVLVIPSR